MPDLYDVLKISKTSSNDEIRKAFRKLAMEHHPDKNNGNKDSEEMFKKVNEAYNVLSDPGRRKLYDEKGIIDENTGDSHEMDIHDILKNVFGGGDQSGFSFMFSDGNDGFPFRNMGPKKKAVDMIEVPIDICDIYYGRTKKVEFELLDLCERCNGCGAQDPSHIINCITCHGKGSITQQVGPFFMQRGTCPSCMGRCQVIKKDKVCHGCKGEKVVFTKRIFELKLPKGIPNNHEIKMEKKGSYELNSKTHRDIIFIFKHNISPPNTLDENMNTTCRVSITVEELLAGFTKTLVVYKDPIIITSDRYFNPNKPIVMKEKGVFNNKKQKNGDILLKFDVVFIDSERLSKYNEFLQKVLKKEAAPINPQDETKVFKIQDLL